MSWGADEPAPEPELGYDGYPKGSSVRQGRVALEPPMPVLLQSRPPPPVPRLDLSSTFNSTFDAFKGSTLNSLDASMDLGEMGASRLMPSEIGDLPRLNLRLCVRDDICGLARRHGDLLGVGVRIKRP